MELTPEARQILEILAEEYEKNPESRFQGIPQRVLGARIGAYLNNVMYPIAELIDAGLVSRVDSLVIHSNIVITDNGYRYIRPLHYRVVHSLSQHRLLVIICIIVTIIGIIIGVANLLK